MTTPRDRFVESVYLAYFRELAGTEYDSGLEEALQEAKEMITEEINFEAPPYRPMSCNSRGREA